jgi:EmrB/QacA subfamily drug resistance transporter
VTTADTPAAAPSDIGRLAKRLALAAAILGSSVAFLDGSIVNVALPAIQRDLGGGLAAQQWVVDAYLLTLGSLILVGGSLGDIFGERRVFTLGVAGFGAASLLCAAAPTANALIAFRGLQGIFGALLTPSSLAVIASTFEGDERGAAIGTWTAWSGVSAVAGPLVGGWLIDAASWRWIFLINVPLVVVTIALVFAAVPAREAVGRAKVDVLGGALCAVSLGGTVFGFIEQPRLGWSSPAIWGALAAGVLLFAAFLEYERRSRHPMLPLGLFARRNFSVTNLETLVVYAGLSTLTFFLVLFLQQIVGWSALESGLALLPVTIVMFLFSGRVGRMSERVGPRIFMGTGPLVAAAGLLLFAFVGRDLSYWVEILPGMLLFSVGLTLTVAPLTATVLSEAGRDDAGIASGINNAVARVAGLLGIAVVGLVVASGNRLTEHGFHLAMAITAALLASGGVVGLAGIRNPRREGG